MLWGKQYSFDRASSKLSSWQHDKRVSLASVTCMHQHISHALKHEFSMTNKLWIYAKQQRQAVGTCVAICLLQYHTSQASKQRVKDRLLSFVVAYH